MHQAHKSEAKTGSQGPFSSSKTEVTTCSHNLRQDLLSMTSMSTSN